MKRMGTSMDGTLIKSVYPDNLLPSRDTRKLWRATEPDEGQENMGLTAMHPISPSAHQYPQSTNNFIPQIYAGSQRMAE